MHNAMRKALFVLFGVIALSGCITNPVTGKREFRPVGEGTELNIGAQNYAPMRQSQGGDYELDPALQDYVSGVGQRLAANAKRSLPYEFVVLNNSIPNAWALPGGKIAINRGLLTELNSESELAAVLGHEIVHADAGHSAQQMSRGMLLQGALLATQVAAHDNDYGNIIVGAANVGAQLLMSRYGRKAELESDYYGMEHMAVAGYNPDGAVNLQKTFVRLSEGRRSDWLSGLFASHPPSDERVAANIQTANQLPRGGEFGNDRYRAAMARTMRAKPAYDAYDEGRKALSEKRPDIAMAKANEAIAREPGEAHFYALRGDANFLKKDYQGAVREYTNAIRRNGDFFYYHLQRGLVAERLGSYDMAAQDLQASLKYLPTGPAFYSLGNLALRAGQRDTAKQYFKQAAGAQGELGQAAQASLMRLDLPDNPEQYLQKRTGLDAEGKLLIAINNPTAVPVNGLALAIQYVDANGQTRTVNRSLRGTLGAGQSSQFSSGLGPFSGTNQYRVAIVQAQVAQ